MESMKNASIHREMEIAIWKLCMFPGNNDGSLFEADQRTLQDVFFDEMNLELESKKIRTHP